MQTISARMEGGTDPVELRRLAVVAAGIGILAQVGLPLIHGYGRTVVTILSVLALFAAAVLHSLSESGQATLMALLVFVGGGLVVEAVGAAVGFPFGSYDYSRTLGVHVLGVPVVVPLAWMMLGWPAFVAGRKIGNTVFTGTTILVAWDLFLDPQMVKAGHWAWLPTSWPKLNGIPLSNTIGWAVVAAAMMYVLDRFVEVEVGSEGLPLLVLAWTWFSSIIGALLFGLSSVRVALVGGVALTLALFPVVVRVMQENRARAEVQQQRRRTPPGGGAGPARAAGSPQRRPGALPPPRRG